MKLLELKQKRAALIGQMTGLANKVAGESRGMDVTEKESWDKMVTEEASLRSAIEAIEHAASLETTLNDQRAEHNRQQDNANAPTYDEAFVQWLRSASGAVAPESRSVLAARENRTGLVEGTQANGGYTVPTGFLAVLTEAMKFFGGIRTTRAKVIRTSGGAPLQIPTVNDASSYGSILGETVADSFTTATFAQVTLNAYKYTSGIMPVSLELMQDGAFDLSGYIARWMGERIGRKQNQDATVGDGSGKPAGVIPNLTAVLAASGTAIALSDIQGLIYSVDAAYRANAEFMLHDQIWGKLMLLNDTTGRPLINGLNIGVAVKQPDTLLGYPVRFNQEMASTLAVNNLVLAFGDFSSVTLRDAMEPTLVRFNERFADQYMVGFSCIARFDSKYIDAGTHPLKVLKMAAS